METNPDFRFMFELNPALIVVLDPDLNIVTATDAYLRATMRERNELTGKNIFEVFPENPFDKNASGRVTLHASLDSVLKSRKADKMPVTKYDIRQPQSIGGFYEERYWMAENTPLLDANGEIKYILLKIEDVTSSVKMHEEEDFYKRSNIQLKKEIEDRKNVEEELKKSEQKFRVLIENLPIGIWLLDTNGKIMYGNAAAQNIWAETKNTHQKNYVEYKAWWLNSGKPVATNEWAAVRALNTGEPIFGEELKIQQFNGNFRIISNSAIPLKDKGGNIFGLVTLNEDITDRKNVEQALKESEKRLRSIFENSMDAILLTEPTGRIIMSNSAATKMFGYTEQELVALGREAVIDATDPRLNEALQERKRKGQCTSELNLKRKDGSIFPAEISSAIFVDENGGEWTSMFIREITERKAADREKEILLKKLEQEKIWLEAVLQRAPLGILLVRGQNAEIVNPNNYAIELFGENVDWTLGRKAVLGFVSDAETAKPLSFDNIATSKAFKGEKTISKEELIVRKDGTRIPILVSSGPIMDRHDNIMGVVTFFQNISQLKETENNLHSVLNELDRERRWLQAILERSPIGIITVSSEDPQHPVPNAYVRNLFGSSVKWENGRKAYLNFIYDAEGNSISENELASARLLQGEKIKGTELQLHLPDGQKLPIMLAGGPIEDEHGKRIGAVAFFQDISTLKELERLREEWSAVVAHDLRQPISAVQLAAGLLKKEKDISENAKNLAEMIESGATQLQRMTHDLLEVSQLESKKLKLETSNENIGVLLKKIAEKLQVLFPDNRIEVRVLGKIPETEIDAGRFEQIIGNLISNASKYGYPHTPIVLQVIHEQDTIHITVTNEGKGIEQDEINNLFQRFHRSREAKKSRIKGIGLGLYLTKGLIEAHGGKIGVTSIPGKKTAFHIDLPVKIKEEVKD